MNGSKDIKHYWDVCVLCGPMVVCGSCGNNCCNGGYGEVPGPEPDTLTQCPYCPSAYEKQRLEGKEHGF